jgi:hypothetical protein
MIVEKQMECRLEGETEVLGENLPQRHFCPSQNPTWPDSDFFFILVCEAIGTAATPGLGPGFEPGPPRWEAGD